MAAYSHSSFSRACRQPTRPPRPTHHTHPPTHPHKTKRSSCSSTPGRKKVHEKSHTYNFQAVARESFITYTPSALTSSLSSSGTTSLLRFRSYNFLFRTTTPDCVFGAQARSVPFPIPVPSRVGSLLPSQNSDRMSVAADPWPLSYIGLAREKTREALVHSARSPFQP